MWDVFLKNCIRRLSLYICKKFIFVETSKEEYSSEYKYTYIENIPEKFISMRRRASGISEEDTSFLLQAKQLSCWVTDEIWVTDDSSSYRDLVLSPLKSLFLCHNLIGIRMRLLVLYTIAYLVFGLIAHHGFPSSTLQVQNRISLLQFMLANLPFLKLAFTAVSFYI